MANNLIERIDRHMRGRGWTRNINLLGEIEWEKPGEWRVQVAAAGPSIDWWAIQAAVNESGTDFGPSTLADVGYLTASECNSFEEFCGEMVNLCALPWECPYCGKAGGEPRTAYSRYLYGADADGNRGE